ncbi:unnamed protein product [Schistocephalus solidus]|uniref:Uncharacterized protein n=1 Tax=Schistocephalus solidus TaxID=70667 RepID=A0A183TLZ0_SCHSO|nr:unnamed protein product [Schistocephalus solidus]
MLVYFRRSSLSPDHARDDVLTFASQLLYAFVQTLEAGVARCVTDPAHSSNVADLSVRPLVAASDAEIVALLLSPLLPILARWPIYLYRATLHRSASSFDGNLDNLWLLATIRSDSDWLSNSLYTSEETKCASLRRLARFLVTICSPQGKHPGNDCFTSRLVLIKDIVVYEKSVINLRTKFEFIIL